MVNYETSKKNSSANKDRSYWGEVFYRLRKNNMAMLSLFILIILISLCVLVPIVSPYAIETTNMQSTDQKPSSEHLLGTDKIGRDLFVRLFYAGRISLGVALAVVALECSIGVVLGSLSGFYGGIVDALIMRLAEVFLSFPFMIICITIVSIFGNSVPNLIFVLAILSWPSIARIVRGQILTLREMEYMEACEALGISDFKRIFKHLLPNVLAYVIVYATLGMAGVILTETSLSFLGLGVSPPTPTYGEIMFNGEDMLKVSDERIREIRGNDISFIFQEPMTSLNPIFKIGYQISETMMLHRGMSKKEAYKESIKMLELVKIPNPERVANDYPFALSGGMRQRAMIAMALACEPKLLIADEPTTALDVTIQAQVLDLMNELKKDINASIIFITHDLGVISEMSDRVMVMYAGKVVEVASAEDIFKNPRHPYTIGLIASKPDMATTSSRLHVIPGNVPDLSNLPTGCPFHPRCSNVMDECKIFFPNEVVLEGEHRIACYLYSKKGVTQHE